MNLKVLPVFALACLSLLAFVLPFSQPADRVQFHFKGKKIYLAQPMSVEKGGFVQKSPRTAAELRLLSNVFYPEKQYVEIVRQDHPTRPRLGIALGFEFDENNGEYPYTPAHAVVQIKDFGYGGVEFDRRDTLNYTGVSNEVSDDVSIEIDSFINDTIFGRFSGLLLSGSGKMTPLDSGLFRIGLRRFED